MAVITVLDRTFPSKKALWEHCQKILHAAPLGTLLTGAEAGLMEALLQRHRHADEILGAGIAGVVVELDSYGGRHFEVRRLSGEQRAYSYRKTIYSVSPKSDRRQRARSAFRGAVFAQTDECKAQATGQMCPMSGRVLRRQEVDVDHVGKPFKEILVEFLALEGLALEEVDVLEHHDTFSLKDTSQEVRWQEYHRVHASLQAVHRDAHRAKEGAEIRPLHQTYLKGSHRHRTPPVVMEDDEDLDELLAGIL